MRDAISSYVNIDHLRRIYPDGSLLNPLRIASRQLDQVKDRLVVLKCAISSVLVLSVNV